MTLQRFVANKIMNHVTRNKKERSMYYEICVDTLARKLSYDDLVRLLDVIVNEEDRFEEKLFEI